jgi:hypothetical protein
MVKAIVQLFDFLFKAGAVYIATPAGQKEWNDVQKAVEEAVKK